MSLDGRFVKGLPPVKHKEGCSCFRCTKIPWNKGKRAESISLAKRGVKRPDMQGENHWFYGKHPNLGAANAGWKGDSVSYSGLHKWVARQLGNPTKCVDCGTITAKKYEWANISGEYKRDITDWKRLCIPCHRKFDNWSGKVWTSRRR